MWLPDWRTWKPRWHVCKGTGDKYYHQFPILNSPKLSDLSVALTIDSPSVPISDHAVRSCQSVICPLTLQIWQYVRSTHLNCTYSTFAQDRGQQRAFAPLSIRHGLWAHESTSLEMLSWFARNSRVCSIILVADGNMAFSGPSFLLSGDMPFFAGLIFSSS